jgi:hypothetical protein
MDNFPPRKAFNDILQNPQVAFRDAELKGVTIERDAMNLPRARAGTFADVYRALLPNKKSRAIRVFASAQPERQERYLAIHNHLSRQSLGCLVPFVYSEKGIRAPNGKWYPLITMDWIEGDTLFDWLAKRAESNDGRTIGSVCEKWRGTALALSRANIAHGDLQHANVMITASNDIKLVDYDGMCVPQLVGRRNLEIGVEPYQHPSRDGNTLLSLGLDNFSSMFIYVGLKALSAEPRLWSEFVTQPLYDKMLFRREDLADPVKSPLFGRLRRSPDSEVQRLSATLCELSRVRMDQVPFLEELLAAFDFNVVRSCLNRRDFDAAIGLLTRNGKKVADAPPDLQPGIRDAQQRIAKLAELVTAIDSGNEKSMASLVGSPLLHNYPGATAAVAAAKDAPGVIAAIQRLESARAGRRWRDLVREWDASQPVLTRPNGSLRKSAAVYQADVVSWRAKNILCDQVLAAIRAPSRDLAALHAAWTKLTELGGHPECDPQRRTIEGLLATYRPVQSPPAQSPKAPVTLPALRPQSQSQPARPLSRPAPPATAQLASQPTPQAVTTPLPQPIPRPAVQLAGQPVQCSTSFTNAIQPAVNVASTPLQTAWTLFATEAVNSTVAVILRWVPPARWLAQRIPAGAITPGVIMKAVALSLAATAGAFSGAMLGEGVIALKPSLGRLLDMWLHAEQLRTLSVAIGAVLALIVGQNLSIRRPGLASWRQLLIGTAFVVIAALTTVGLERFVPAESISSDNTWHSLGLWMCRNLSHWCLLGAAMGFTATRIIPNFRIVPAVVGGITAGAVASLADMTIHASVNETAGRLVGAGCLGIVFGMVTAIAEAATRRYFLEIDRGGGFQPAQISLGSRAVTAGSDASSCDILVRDALRPLTYKYWVDNQQIYLLDYATNQPARVSVGDRRALGSFALVIAENSRQTIPTGSRPSPLVATSQPTRQPQTVMAPPKASAATPLSRPVPPAPPPPRAP